uniref:tRNA-dihydrouridine synthase n=1 Tax=Paulinella micropora TaxID=1928728 RepID=A0A385I0B3_9EUKA|nr:hypothetical protein PMNZ_408 [Paulinella micropora]AXY63351.1 hypothetical protein PMNZ_408 [Paulinella micropora]
MMNYTDRHFRVIMREISKHCLLYTEMIVAHALTHCQREDQIKKIKRLDRLIGFSSCEKPISLQVGGDDPLLLAEAARLATRWQYDEINLNVGCPSNNVQKGHFGACLMAESAHVARCVNAMVQETHIPVTVKHRIGIDHKDSYEQLLKFIDQVASAGANRFSIHARKAWLSGLDPKENRMVPPLNHSIVRRLKNDRPHLLIELNGGLTNLIDCQNALSWADGVMVGRKVYENPLYWKELDRLLFNDQTNSDNRPSAILFRLYPYAKRWYETGGRIWPIARHIVHLVQGIQGARRWRRWFTEVASNYSASPQLFLHAAIQLEDAGY